VNLLSSQGRALGVLQFLTSDPGIPEPDRDDLMRIATVSGASFSRPPRDCPTREVRCRKVWRRVEIRINLTEERTRAGFMQYLERIRRLIDGVETD
jgi:outer membrane protein OmpA-like peptidoglycan-associated protein